MRAESQRVKNPPDVVGVVLNAECIVNEIGDALACPQVIVIARGDRAVLEQRDEPTSVIAAKGSTLIKCYESCCSIWSRHEKHVSKRRLSRRTVVVIC